MKRLLTWGTSKPLPADTERLSNETVLHRLGPRHYFLDQVQDARPDGFWWARNAKGFEVLFPWSRRFVHPGTETLVPYGQLRVVFWSLRFFMGHGAWKFPDWMRKDSYGRCTRA